jgi:hypothetical protein
MLRRAVARWRSAQWAVGAPRVGLRTGAGLRGGVGRCTGAGLLRRRVGRVDLGSWMRALLAALGN